jgi:DNA repair protein SbcD/Mre11
MGGARPAHSPRAGRLGPVRCPPVRPVTGDAYPPGMRILHTSDWHVGKTMRGRSRADEHAAVLTEITTIAQAEAVDLVVVAGDQFDTAAPGPESERIVWRALLDLAATGAEVVVVAGNHDHPARLTAVGPLLHAGRIHSAAVLARPEEGGCIDVTVRTGETARIALLPFLSQRGIVRADDLMAAGADQHAGTYAGRMRAVVEALCAGFGPDTVNLVVAHLMVAGGVLGGGERSAHTIFDYAVPATALPATAHYAALGHLHRPQLVPAPCPAWYSGSPLQLDFGETDDRKAVLLIEATPALPARIEQRPLDAGRRLRTLRGTLTELEALAGSTDDDHLRVVVRGPARAGLADQVREWFPGAVDVTVERPDQDAAQAGQRARRLGRSPAELFAEYLSHQGATDERVQALFAELLEEAHAPDQA